MIVSDQIIAVINDVCAKFGIVIDWTQENVIPYLQDLFARYITYTIVMNICHVIIPWIVFFIALAIFKRNFPKADWYDLTLSGFLVIVSGIAMGVSLILGIGSLIIAVEEITVCLTIPEKIIFDYIISLSA